MQGGAPPQPRSESITTTDQPTQTDGTGNIGAWIGSEPPGPELGPAFDTLVDEIRRLQALATGSRPTVEVTLAAAEHVRAAADLLADFQVDETRQIAGKRVDVPGRAQFLAPPVFYDRADAAHVRARVTFSRFYLGGGNAVHGGTVPLLFDELLGRLAGAGGRTRSRTAHLHVDYRHVTPLDRELQIVADLDRIEGRKIFISGTMRDGDTLLCEVEGLFVTLLPGQP